MSKSFTFISQFGICYSRLHLDTKEVNRMTQNVLFVLLLYQAIFQTTNLALYLVSLKIYL